MLERLKETASAIPALDGLEVYSKRKGDDVLMPEDEGSSKKVAARPSVSKSGRK